MSPLARLAEWFGRAKALERAAMLSFRERRSRAETLRLSEQRARAAAHLWDVGHSLEGLRLQLDALRLACQLPSSDRALEDLGASRRVRGQIRDARACLALEAPPDMRNAAPELRRVFVCAQRGQRALARLHSPLVAGRDGIRFQRRLRLWGSGALILSIAAAAWLWANRPEPPTVFASGAWPDGRYPAEHVFDGLEHTEWLMPDRTRGWVEKRFEEARDIDGVRVLNGHNPPYNDRAVRRMRVQLYRGDELLASEDANFSRIEASPEWLDVEIRAEHVTRLRIDVVSFHRSGSALAEVRFGPFDDEPREADIEEVDDGEEEVGNEREGHDTARQAQDGGTDTGSLRATEVR